ncbi:type II toxin-antitoxin system RatA family toxin [Nocardia sp. CA-119907]|uniref:type II toxin-antitoxin system RatA family toxin n=1 Tax=Nocardia sp. CA-119907 TaxID=3239973 RepID=UPI003D9534F3
MNSRHQTAAPADVWEVLLDCESFPDYMGGVNEVEILEEDGPRRTSSWVVELKGSEMEWEQEDLIDAERHRIEFRQTDGDLQSYHGYWQLHEDGAGGELELNVEFDIGLPLVAEMIHPAIATALEGYANSIVTRAAR